MFARPSVLPFGSSLSRAFNIFSLGDRTTSGISTGFLDKVLDGNVTLTDSSASETWAM